MPRDIAGNYTLPAGNPVVPNTIIATNWANTTMQDIADALTASLSVDGSVTTAKIADDAVTRAKMNGLDVNGMVAAISATEFEGRTITAPAAGITVSDGDGVAGNPTLALANDLAGLEGLAGTGLPARTAADTWAVRTLTGTANQVVVADGDGVAANPTFSLSTDLRIPSSTTRIVGSSSGNANIALLGFYESDGTTRKGVIGDGVAGDSNIYITADAGNIIFTPNSGAILPSSDGTVDLGSVAQGFDEVFVNGVVFPGIQVASADANTLDDYEEGTFTPTLTFATAGNVSVAYSTRSGKYTKIGKLVIAEVIITTSTFTHTTSSGNLQVTGLPFQVAGDVSSGASACLTSNITFAASTTQIAAIASVGTSLAIFQTCGSGVAAIQAVQHTEHTTGNNSTIRFNLVYIASA